MSWANPCATQVFRAGIQEGRCLWKEGDVAKCHIGAMRILHGIMTSPSGPDQEGGEEWGRDRY